jgi:hypothetical protein
MSNTNQTSSYCHKDISSILAENSALKNEIELLERQLRHFQAEKEKIVAAHRAVVSQHIKENSVLRANFAQLKLAYQSLQESHIEKERELEAAIVQLSSKDDEKKYADIFFRKQQRLAEFKPQPTKYGSKEILRQKAINDALRIELHKLRSETCIEHIRLLGEINEKNSEVTILRSQINDLKTEVEANRLSISKSNLVEESLRRELLNTEHDLDVLKTELARNQANYEVAEQSFAQRKESIETILRQKDASIDLLREQIRTLHQHFKGMHIQISDLKAELTSSQNDFVMEGLNDDRDRLTIHLERLIQENERLMGLVNNHHISQDSDNTFNVNILGNSEVLEPSIGTYVNNVEKDSIYDYMEPVLTDLTLIQVQKRDEKWKKIIAQHCEKMSREWIEESQALVTQFTSMEQKLALLVKENKRLEKLNSDLQQEKIAKVSYLPSKTDNPTTESSVIEDISKKTLSISKDNNDDNKSKIDKMIGSIQSIKNSKSKHGIDESEELKRQSVLEMLSVCIEKLLPKDDAEYRSVAPISDSLMSKMLDILQKGESFSNDESSLDEEKDRLLVPSIREKDLEEKLSSALASEKSIMNKLTEVQSNYNESIVSLQTDGRRAKMQIANLKNQLEEAYQTIEQMRLESKESHALLDKKIKEVEVSKEKLIEQTRECEQIRQTIRDQQGELILLRSIKEESDRKLIGYDLDINNTSAALTQRTEYLEEVSAECSRLNQEIEILQDELRKLSIENKKFNSKVEMLNQKLKKACEDKSSLQLQLTKALEALRSKTEEEVTLHSQLEVMQKELHKVSNERSEYQVKLLGYTSGESSSTIHSSVVPDNHRLQSLHEITSRIEQLHTQLNAAVIAENHLKSQKTSNHEEAKAKAEHNSIVPSSFDKEEEDEEMYRMDSSLNESRVEESVDKLELRRLRTRCKALESQIQSMPGSLQIAQAEKRVAEAKLLKAVRASKAQIEKDALEWNQKLKELESILSVQV